MTMLDLYPERLLASGETKGILAALSEAVGAAETAQEEFFRQFCIQTATYGLAWMEAYLGLPIGEGRPLGERRAAILGKLQGQGPATKAAVTELVRTFLGAGAEIEEKNAESRILVRYDDFLSDEPKKQLMTALYGWIPAQLEIYYNRVCAVSLRNSAALVMHSFVVHTHMDNFLMAPVLLDGRHILDGSWLLDQRITDHFHLRSIKSRTSLCNENLLRAAFCIFIAAKEQHRFTAAASARIKIKNKSRYFLRAFQMKTEARNKNESVVPITSRTVAHRQSGFLTTPEMRTEFRNRSVFITRRYTVHLSSRNRNTQNAVLTTDTMWLLDGSFLLDGTRRLNAAVLTAEI